MVNQKSHDSTNRLETWMIWQAKLLSNFALVRYCWFFESLTVSIICDTKTNKVWQGHTQDARGGRESGGLSPLYFDTVWLSHPLCILFSQETWQPLNCKNCVNGTSAQLCYTVPFTLVHAGKYVAEDKSKTDTTKTKDNPEQESCAIAKMTARCALYK